MKNKKALGIILSFALLLSVVVPGTLAMQADTDSAEAGFSVEEDWNQIPDGDTIPVNEEAPVEEETPVGDEAPAQDETPAEIETPAEPEQPAHMEGCSEECTTEGCACPCHELSLFERLMACETLEELFAIVDETPQEALLALTEEENAQIEAKIDQLEPEPLPPVVIEETSDVPVVSEIIYPTVNFDNVAPFGAPVEG